MLNKKIIVGILFLGLLTTSIVFAGTISYPNATSQCIAQAISVRETALYAGLSDYTRSLGIAYSERATSLQSAYTKTTEKEIKSAVKTSWTNFSTFVKSVKNKWSIAKSSAWSNFRSSVKNCNAPGAISDVSKSGTEI